jgi:hypothetical protein
MLIQIRTSKALGANAGLWNGIDGNGKPVLARDYWSADTVCS